MRKKELFPIHIFKREKYNTELEGPCSKFRMHTFLLRSKNYLTAVNNVLFILTLCLKNCYHLEYYLYSILKELFEVMLSTVFFCSC